MSNIRLPKEYAFPMVSVLGTFWLSFWQCMKMYNIRQIAKIEYPQFYAEKAEAAARKEAQIMNCTQRAHQNTLEFLPQVAIATLVLGLRHPRVAASMCGVWTIFRVIYTIGYCTGDPLQRNKWWSSVGHMLTYLGLTMGATYTGVKLAIETLTE